MKDPDVNLKTTATHDGEEFNVSTVELPIPHGPERNQHYETLVSGPRGGETMRRYEDREAAREGHERVCRLLEQGEYEREAMAWTLNLPDE